MTANIIELALAQHFGWRQHLIVPNVSWGLGLGHEADLLILKPSRKLWEIEIKVTASDLKRDLKKKNGHFSNLIQRFYFAMPRSMAKYSEFVPEHAGILLVNESEDHGVEMVRPAKLQNSLYVDDGQALKLYHLAAMRIWNLKRKIIELSFQKL